MMYGFGEHGWGMGLGWITGLIILVILVWIIVKALQQNNNPKQKSALDVIKERYARGEISKKEYEEKKNGIL